MASRGSSTPSAVSATPSARFRDLGFQARLTLVAAVAVAFPVTAAAVASYFIVQASLVAQIDDSLRFTAGNTGVRFRFGPDSSVEVRVPQEPFGGVRAYYQVLGTDGRTYRPVDESSPLPVSDGDRRVVAGTQKEAARDATVKGVHMRILTTRIAEAITLQVAEPSGGCSRHRGRCG